MRDYEHLSSVGESLQGLKHPPLQPWVRMGFRLFYSIDELSIRSQKEVEEQICASLNATAFKIQGEPSSASFRENLALRWVQSKPTNIAEQSFKFSILLFVCGVRALFKGP